MIELEELGMLPQALERFTKAFSPGPRRRARDRPDRLRQDDDALRRAEPAQHAREEHHHDRGPGRVPARRHHPGPGQQQGGPDVRRRPALDAARRPRHHHGRRDPRPGDGADRDPGGADRPPRALDAAHQRRPGRRLATDRDGDRAVPGRLVGRLRGRPAARAPAVRGVQAAHHDHRRGDARERLQRRARPRGLRAVAAPAAAARATRAGSASTRSGVSETIRSLAVAREPAETIAHAAVHEGMMRLREDGLEKVRRGITSIAEIARVAGTR